MVLQHKQGAKVIASPIQSLHYRHRDGLTKPFKYDWNDSEIVCYNKKGEAYSFPIRLDQNDWVVFGRDRFKVVSVEVINSDYTDYVEGDGKLF